MRRNLRPEDLARLLDAPKCATLATYRRDGSVLLSPVWHEWRDGGFSMFTEQSDVKLRHIERRSQAVMVVSDNVAPYGGVEVTAMPQLIRDVPLVRETTERI